MTVEVVSDAHNRALDQIITLLGERNYWRHHSRSAENRLAKIAEYIDASLIPEPFVTDLLRLLIA